MPDSVRQIPISCPASSVEVPVDPVVATGTAAIGIGSSYRAPEVFNTFLIRGKNPGIPSPPDLLFYIPGGKPYLRWSWMKPGDFVLDIVREVPKNRRTIILIRHANRDSFEGIPDHLREGVELTPEGILMAREFGGSLGEIFPGKPLVLGHTVAHRCRMTAESIRDGYPSTHPARILGCEPEIKSPVVHQERYIAIRNELGWREVIRKWLDREIPENTFHNPHRYSDYVLRNLFSCPLAGENDLFVVIAHDITIFPIISRVFGAKVKPVEFLNGIVITGDAAAAEFQYADAEVSLKAKRKIPLSES